MKKILPLLVLVSTLTTLSACSRAPKLTPDMYTENNSSQLSSQSPTPASESGPELSSDQDAQIPDLPASNQSDDEILNEINSQTDLSVDSDLSEIESQL